MVEKTKELLNRSGTSPKKAQAKTATSVITDAQWQQISEVSGLPLKARRSIEGQIRFYRDYQWSREPTASEIRSELRNCAKKLTTAVEFCNGDMFAYYLQPHDDWPSDRIKRLVIEAEGFAKLLNWAASNLPSGKTGPDSWPLCLLIHNLYDHLRSFGGPRMSLSKKRYGPDNKWNVADYIYRTCKSASPRLTDNTIRHAMVKVMRETRAAGL